MAANIQISSRLLVIIFLSVQFFSTANSAAMGVNFGKDKLKMLDTKVVNLLNSAGLKKVRIFADPAVLKSLANTDIEIAIAIDNGDIPTLASFPNAATQWVENNVLAFHPATKIRLITVGNEVLTSEDPNIVSHLLPAMKNLQDALKKASLDQQVLVSTAHSMGLLHKRYPPSEAFFDQKYEETLKALLQFQSSAHSPFLINLNPYFLYGSYQTPDNLAYCLFEPNEGRIDKGKNRKYTNMFDQQVDAIRTALDATTVAESMEVVVSEAGWPLKGDPEKPGATIENAKIYFGNLIKHLSSKVGTPLVPKKPVEAYIFSLYNEDYDVELVKNVKGRSNLESSSNSEAAPSTAKAESGKWCMARHGLSDAQLQGNIDYACGQGIDCNPIKPEGACFEPDNLRLIASYAMNLYYQSNGGNPWNCDFSNTGILTDEDPSTDACKYPSNNVKGHSNLKSSSNSAAAPSTPEAGPGKWCMARHALSDAQLQRNIEYACSQGIDCNPIKPGGACFVPDNLRKTASYAMNLYYQSKGQNRWSCDFSNTGLFVDEDPSTDTCKYPSNYVKGRSNLQSSSNSAAPTPKAGSEKWCMARHGLSDAQLQRNIEYACSQGIDCNPIKPGGACFVPDNLRKTASYAMNLYYQSNGGNPWNCDFSNTGILTEEDPSTDACKYPSNNVKGHSNLESSSNSTTAPPPPKAGSGKWCMARHTASDAQLQGNIDYACSQGIDCNPIKPGGACFQPNNLRLTASYAMNLYYKLKGGNSWNCDFSKTGILIDEDPSTDACKYPSN